jgi:hypothetical protein
MSLVFLMARPVLTHQGILASGKKGARIVIIDNSLSMSYKEDNGERFDLAKKAAREILGGLKGQVTIIPTAPSPNRSNSEEEVRWMEPEEALKELSSIRLSFGQGDPTSALDMASRKLKDLKMDKEILVISDMTRGDWEGFNLSKLSSIPSETEVNFLRIGGPNRDPNLAIRRVRLIEGEAVVGVPSRLEGTVSNLSDQSQSTLVELYIASVKVDQKMIEVKAGEEGKAYFELFLDRPGWINGEVRLRGDRLSLDDLFYFPLKVREKIKVLIVDGDPKTSLKASESYFLVNALHPGGSEGSPFATRVITEEGLAGVDMKPYEAVFLLNVARPQASKISSFLESSKPLFIFLGDRVVPEEYNSLPLFPWRIKEVVETKPEKIGQIDESYEALRLFYGSGGESLRSASFRRYFKVQGSTKNHLALENRDSLLVAANLGKGKLFLFSSSADLDWNDLPLKAAYLPLIQGLIKEEVGLAKSSLPAGLVFGQPFEERGQPNQLMGARGGPGIYQFIYPSGEVRRGVNTPPEESDLSKVSDAEIKKKFGTMNVKVVEYREGAISEVHAGRKELWPFILGFLLMVLAAEMGIANGIPRLRKE